ncbi:hypothetical protein [Polyangium jinanense]|uniref:Lipoprotein n=1 Tax=Polyangium jinanense TaxID=2829994 RepID=A0A9X3X5L9_9BACT|nr:hypothetical protein [Polyangium jinanense]MDC3955495.1 hypothetical protein [Polyangium jinanense]MDC3981796.1 hypothetical protein [Polyangium jinanense]
MKTKAVSRLLPVLSLGLFLVGCGEEEALGAAACTTGETYGAITTKLAFSRLVSPTVAPGFDLDGRTSDSTDSLSCGKADFTDADGRSGVDNQLAPLVPEVEKFVGDAIDGLLQGSINDGQLVILMEMENVDDFTNDTCVNLGVQVGVKKRPTLGTDGIIEAYQTFEPDPAASRSYVMNARIENGVLETGPFALAIPLAIFDVAFTLNVQDARFRFTIDEEHRLKGILGGGVLPQEIIDGVKDGDGLEDLLPQIKLLLDANTDLAYNEDTGKCEQLSATLDVEGVPAFLRR